MIVYTKALATSLIISRGLCAGHGKVLLGVVYCQAVADCASITLEQSIVESGFVVCQGRHHGKGREFLRNLSAPMPLPSKLRLIIKNNFIKISRLQGCCGHPGEPGC